MAVAGLAGASLQVSITARSIVKASDPTKHTYVLPVSNLDLIPAPNPTAALYIYPNPRPSRDFTSVVATIKSSLPAILNHFFPFAGRITTNPTTGRPELLCNNAGAELIEAQANVPLAALDFHNPKESIDKIILRYHPELALCVQVVGFACGGFSIVWSSNHLLVDAYSLNLFSRSWAELARTNKLSRAPKLDRSILRTRSPPRFSPSVDLAYTTCTPDGMINALAGDVFLRRLYYVAASDIHRLQAVARMEGRAATRMEAFSAYVWKALAEVVGDSDQSCRMGWLVDGRRWVGGGRESEGLRDYVGNVLTYAVGEAGVRELREAPLPQVAGMVARAIGAVADEGHFRDLVDWAEGREGKMMFPRVQLGLGTPAIVVSSCHHLSMGADFGCGDPVMGTFMTMGGRLGAGFLGLMRSGKGDGSWIVQATLWPKVAAALEAFPDRFFKPLTAEYLGLVVGPRADRPGLASRM